MTDTTTDTDEWWKQDKVAAPVATSDEFWKGDKPATPAAPPATWSDTVNDFGRSTSNAVTFGMANRAKAAIDYGLGRTDAKSISEAIDEQAHKSEVARERSPVASTVGDVYGTLAIPGFGAEALAAKMGSRALGRAVGYGVTGAATGAAQGAGNTYSGKTEDYATNALIGGAMGGVLGGVGGAAFGTRPLVSAAKTPTAVEQGAARDFAYDTLRASPAQYTPESFSGRGYDIENQLRLGRNAHEDTSPQSFRTVEQMHNPPTAAAVGRQYLTPADLEHVRKGVTGDEFRGMTPTDQGSAGVVKRGIDDFLNNPPRGAAVPGTEHLARDAAETADLARRLHAGTKRTELIDEMVRNAERTTGATHSGLNLRNELQKTIRTGLKEKAGDSPFSKAGYNTVELAALDKFSRGQNALSRTLAYGDKLLGGGGGLAALVAGGIGSGAYGKYSSDDAGGGFLKGVGTVAAGLALRKAGNRYAANKIDEIRDLIAQRNPLYEYRRMNAPLIPAGVMAGSPAVAKGTRDAVTLELLNQTKKKERR